MPDEEKKEAAAQTQAVTKVFVENFGYLKIYRCSDGQYEVWDGDRRIGGRYPTLEAARLNAEAAILATAIRDGENAPKTEAKPQDSGLEP